METKMLKCSICNHKANWIRMSAREGEELFWCDDCVPRGCSCQEDEDGKQPLDEQGRQYPCCEYNILTEDDHEDMANLEWDEEIYNVYV